MMTVIFKGTVVNNYPFGNHALLIINNMYPTPQEKVIIHEAEKIMIETMARYDPSHDQYHGERISAIEKYMEHSLNAFLFSSARS